MSPRSAYARLTLALTAALAACSTDPADPTPRPSTLPPPSIAPRVATGELSQLLPLPNGLTAYLQTGTVGSTAQVQLGVFAGSLFGTPGLAELSAETLLRSTDPATGTKSLEQQISALGGAIDVEIGLMTSWFDVRIRPDRVSKALAAVRASLDTVTRSRTQITRMRDELVARRTAEVLAAPTDANARVLMQAERSTARYINHLLDVDPSAVTQFHARFYRPERCVLAVRSPQKLERIVTDVTGGGDASIATWSPPPAMPGESRPTPRQFESGLYWAELEGSKGTTCSIVMRLPDPSMPRAADWLVMHACLTLDGTGGRLEQLQEQAGLAHLQWETRVEQTPDVTALVMTTVAQPLEVAKLWQVYLRARQSLQEIPPSPSELQLALRRAQLGAGLTALTSAARLRLDTNLKTRNVRPDALQRRIVAMSDPAAWDPQEAAQAFLTTPAWMVAVGPSRPEDFDAIPDAVAIELLPGGFDPATQNQATPENLASVDPWLARARAATGGAAAYRSLKGFRAAARVVSEQGLVAEDTLDWSVAGKLTRSRAVVGQAIKTVVDGDRGYEELDGVRKSIERREALGMRHEMMRHPQMLLAAHLRGERRFRPIAQRTLGDRELYIVEAVGEEFDRLRLHIDAESKLIRVVESWERLADDTLVHVREEWSDYRNAGGLRVPHRRRTTWNDGLRESETEFSEWKPK